MGNVPSAVPYDSQLVKINTTLSCSTLGQYDSYNFTLSATAPLHAGAGQEIYYSDVVIGIDLPPVYPASFAVDAPGNYTIPVNVTLDLTNASPTTILISQTVYDVTTAETHIRIPEGDGVLPPIGPVTLEGGVHRFELGQVDFIVGVGGSQLPVSCVKQDPEIIIGTVMSAGDGSNASALAPANGVPGTFPPTQSGQKATIANLPLQYNGFYNLGNRPFNLIFGGVSPTSLTSGQQFYLSELTAFLVIPGPTVQGASAFYGGDTTNFTIELSNESNETGFGIVQPNAYPLELDISREFYSTNSNEGKPLSGTASVSSDPDEDLPIALPGVGSLSVGPFIAGTFGPAIFDVGFEILRGRLSIHGSNGQGGYTDFNATLPYSVALFSANITSGQ